MPNNVPDNDFVRDIYRVRCIRLSNLSRNIAGLSDNCFLPEDLKLWAESAFETFMDAQARKMNAQEAKIERLREYKFLTKQLNDKYKVLKQLLITNLSLNPAEIQLFGFSGQGPKLMDELIEKCRMLLQANSVLSSSGDVHSLPESVTRPLVNLIANIENVRGELLISYQEARRTNQELKRLFGSDSMKLEMLFKILKNGKISSRRLKSLGFSTLKETGIIPEYQD